MYTDDIDYKGIGYWYQDALDYVEQINKTK